MSDSPIKDGFDELSSGMLRRAPEAAVDAYRHYFFAGAAHLLFLLTEDYSQAEYEAMIERLQDELNDYRDALALKIFLSRAAANQH